MRIPVVYYGLVLLLGPLAGPCQTVLPDSTIEQLRIGVRGFKERYHLPSIVVAIVHGNDILFSEALGYTDMEKNISASIDSKYSIQSITKTFTATMYMQLAERGRVLLYDDVKKYVPEFRGESDARGRSGTSLFQLATHTSGLPRNAPSDIGFTKAVDRWLLTGKDVRSFEAGTKKDFLLSLPHIRKAYPDFDLLSYGDRHYSNLGYSLLGIALERAAKTDFETYIQREICRPLRMDQTGFGTSSFGATVLAKGYYFDEALQRQVPAPPFKANSALYAGGMYATARDLARFLSFQFDTTAESASVLSPKSRAMMASLRIGWKPVYPYVLHEGALPGYRSQVIFHPERKIGWVILTNGNDFDFSRINEYFSSRLLPLFTKKEITDLHAYKGTYVLTDRRDSLDIFIKNDSLFSTYLQQELPSTPLLPEGRQRFRGAGRGNYHIGYEFIADEKGNIILLHMGQLVWMKKEKRG
jgi:CubicO group peptidase (beta-lactamase class C family)